MAEFSKEVQISVEVGAELFKDLILSSYRGVIDLVKEKNREHDFFGKATGKYLSGLIRRHNEVQELGMREPVPLKSLFVRANILEKISASSGLLSPEDLACFFDFDRRSFGKTKETVDGELVVNKLRKFIVLGKPGAGKTTYLKYLTLMMLDAHSQIELRKLPVFVTLREWADSGKTLMDFIADQFDICGFEQAGAFVERMLREGNCFLLFDGLDEVSETVKQDEIIRGITDFTDKYYDNQFVVSCRVAAYNHWLRGFTEVEMADFNEAQMETFIKNWFNGEPKVATECWEHLKSSPPLRELASVPLLLTLLCLEYGESNDFPPNRAELYRRAVDTLLTKWDSTRRIRRQEVYKKLSTRQKESMFARIAIGTFIENQYFIAERDLTRMIEKFIKHLPGVKEEETEPDSIVVLKAIEAQHGIFVERAKEIYSFAHLSFQEYFAAKYIADHSRKGTLENLVEKHLYDAKWAEVFKLVAGLLDNADELLLLMRKKTEEALEIWEINELLKLSEASLQNKNSSSQNERMWNHMVFTSHDRAHALARSLANSLVKVQTSFQNRTLVSEQALALAIDRTLELARTLGHSRYIARNNTDIRAGVFERAVDKVRALARSDFDPNYYDDKSFYKTIISDYKNGFDLNQHVTLEVYNYSSSNLLILQCLDSANFVTKPVREQMIHEICLPRRS